MEILALLIYFSKNKQMEIFLKSNGDYYFTDKPQWFQSVSKLPKGYKWSDGTNFRQKGSRKSETENYTFLIIDNDLYIKDFLKQTSYYVVESSEKESVVKIYKTPKELRYMIFVIRNWKYMKPHHVLYEIGFTTSFFDSSFTKFCMENGGNISMIAEQLKPGEQFL